jgi:Protein of unknown function (DUF4235)
VSKALFIPFSILSGLVAGLIGRQLFRGLWRLVDEEEAPDPKHREIDGRKLIAALLLEGAIFRTIRGLADHGARHSFRALTGSWPGKERPEPAGEAD